MMEFPPLMERKEGFRRRKYRKGADTVVLVWWLQ